MAILRDFAIAIFLLLPLPALAWGPEGHEIVAHIAARELSPHARAEVSALLGGEADAMMAADADWADEVRDARPETARWHFVDSELDGDGFVRARDCPQDKCVVAQIEKDVRTAADRGKPSEARVEALKFLIHFVGDVHQPLHCIDNHDRGGNQIGVRIGNYRTTLHHVWDTSIVEALSGDADRIAAEIETMLPPQHRTAWQSGTPADWANESYGVARSEIYARLPARGFDPISLPRDYRAREAPMVAQQLARAGVRLAWLLNTMFK